jgi:hypothetical protein
MQSPCNPFIEDYAEIFYMIDKGDIPSIQCKVSLRGPKSMREADGLSLIFNNFYVPGADSHYIASEQTLKKTSLPTFLVLLHEYLLPWSCHHIMENANMSQYYSW